MTKIASFRPTLVRLTRVGASSPDVLSLSGALPAPHLLPDSLTAAATGVVSSHGLQYGWAEGNLAIRTWIVERMKSRGAVVDTSDIIVTHGAQEALSLIASVLPNGSRVAFDEET